eukprot:1439376-Pleurochrysis_carterae.AAC.2
MLDMLCAARAHFPLLSTRRHPSSKDQRAARACGQATEQINKIIHISLECACWSAQLVHRISMSSAQSYNRLGSRMYARSTQFRAPCRFARNVLRP